MDGIRDCLAQSKNEKSIKALKLDIFKLFLGLWKKIKTKVMLKLHNYVCRVGWIGGAEVIPRHCFTG